MVGNELMHLSLTKHPDASFSYDLTNESIWNKQEPWEKQRDEFIRWALVFVGLTVVFTLGYFIFG